MYVEKLPQTLGKATIEDDVNLTEVRMWFETEKEIEVKPLADHEKQVRKQVCDDIRNKLKENGLLYTWKGEPKYKTIEELLDQIEKGE